MRAPDIQEEVQRLFDAALKLEQEQRGSFLEKNASSADIARQVNKLLAEIVQSSEALTRAASEEAHTEPPTYIGQFKHGELLANRFKVARFMAAGGMGEVYEAEDLELHERVAIKCIRQDTIEQPNALARFRREVHLARKVTHANVCRIYDLFRHVRENDEQQNEVAFVSMEFLAGATLSSLIREKGRFSPEQALPIIEQIAEGLSAAHRAGIVHRDFKPANVMLVPDGDSGKDRVVITDFGLALHGSGQSTRTTDLTVSQALAGTPAYMAPEQIEGRKVTPATDIYAFGLVIYEMLAGVRPFNGPPIFGGRDGNSSSSAPSLRQLVPHITNCWDETLGKCLQRDPAARFSSALEVSKALSGQSATSFPGVARYRRAAGVGLGLAILLALAGTAYYFRDGMLKGRTSTVHAATRPTVAVLGFKNLSRKSDVDWVSPALSEMLGTELTAGEQLRIIPSEQVAHAKTDLSLADDDSLGRDTLSRVRQNLGTDFVVLGSFLDLEGQVRIDVALQSAGAGETIANISESGPEQNLSELAARVGLRLRKKLGIADASPDDAAHARAAQSSSLEATRLYSEALEKLHTFDSPSARDLLERAIAEDPNYALAHAALAECWRSLGYAQKSTAEAKKALDLAGNLPREDRLAIEAQYRNSIHDSARESEIYKTLFNFYPDNLEYGFSLAKSQYFGEKLTEANSTLDALQQLPPPYGDDPRIDLVRAAVAEKMGDYKKTLVLAQRVELRAHQMGARRLAGEALHQQCTCLSKLGQPSEATSACDKARAIFEEVGDHLQEANVWGDIAFRAQNPQNARLANAREIALLKSLENESGLAWAMTVAGELSADSGDYAAALRNYKEALRLNEKIGDQHGIIDTYSNLGWVESSQGDLKDAVAKDELAVNRGEQMNYKFEQDLRLDNLAEALLDQGEVQSATKRLEEGLRINSETGDKRIGIYLHTARSRLLLATAEFDESRREAEQAIKACLEVKDEEGANGRRLLLARLDIAQNHPQAAVEMLRNRLASHQGDQIEARALLIEALLATPSSDSRREVAKLAKIKPDTPNAGVRLAANLQIARVRFALADKESALKILADVESDSHKRGYEAYWLESRLARAEIGLQSTDPAPARQELQQVQQEAETKGLVLIAQKARSAKLN